MPISKTLVDSDLSELYERHDVLRMDLAGAASVSALDPDTLDALRRRQRLLRLSEGDTALAAWLGKAGATSAQDVGDVALSPAGLAQDDEAPSEARLARVHRVAADTRARTHLLRAILHGVRAPHYRHSRFANANAALVERAHAPETSPDLAAVGAELTALTGLDDRPDAFSPSAYLWALRQFIQDNILAPAGAGIADRRPDLVNPRLPRDRDYSERALPYLDLVNELLLKGLTERLKLGPTEEDEALRHLASQAVFPFGLPYHAPLASIRAWLGHLKTDLATIFERMGVDANVTARERLRLSSEQGTHLITTTDIPASWGLRTGETWESLESVATFMSRSGLGFDRTVELVQQDLSDVPANVELRRRLFINCGDTDQPPLSFESKDKLSGLSEHKLGRIQRFVRLADHLGWSLTDLEIALHAVSTPPDITTPTLTRLASVEQLRARLDQPLELVCSLWSDMRTSGVQRRDAPRALFDRVFNEPVLFLRDKDTPYHPQNGANDPYPRNPTYTDAPVHWTPATRTDDQGWLRARLLAALCLQDEELSQLVGLLFPGQTAIPLTVPNLSRMHRAARLASLLGYTPSGLIALRDLIGVAELTTPEEVLQLVQWRDGLDAAGVSVPHLRYLCGDPTAAGAIDPSVNTGYVPANVVPFVEKLPLRDKVEVITADGLKSALGADSGRVLAHLVSKGCVDGRGLVQTPSGEITYGWLAKTLEGLTPKLDPVKIPSLHFQEGFPYVDFGDLKGVHPTGSFTVELWYNAPYSASSQYLVQKGGHGDFLGHGLLWNAGFGSPGYLAVRFGSPQQQLTVGLTADQIGAWTHVAYSWDASEGIARVYLNGVEQASLVPTPRPIQNESRVLTLSWPEAPCTGRLHDLRLWDRARTEDEIGADMHRRLTGAEPGLVCCWPVNEGVGVDIKNVVNGKPDGEVKLKETHTDPKWSDEPPPPMDQRLVAVCDALLRARHSVEAAGVALPAALATFFGAPQARVMPALALAALRAGTGEPLSLLLSPIHTASKEALLKLFAHLAQVLVLAETLNITPEELAALPQTFVSFGLVKIDDELSAAHVLNLHRYRAMAERWAKRSPGLLAVLLAAPDKQRTALAVSTGWRESELTEAMKEVNPPISDLSKIAELHRLHQLYLLGLGLGLDIASLKGLSSLHPAAEPTSWAAYKAGGATALEAANAKADLDDWATISAPIEGRLNELRRDAVGGVYGHLLGFDERLEDLYERLLIDVEMSGCARINRLKQALNSLQLYAHRVAAGLEPGAKIRARAAWDRAWPIMSHYRTWEASQRLLVHTESFIDPTLRAIKTNLYADVERDLLQSDLSDAAASDSFLRYLKGFDALANLEPVSAAYARVTTPDLPTETPTIFLVGRTRTQAPEYCWRRCTVGVVNEQIQVTRWWPWEKLLMSAAIQATSVTPVWVFGRLHLVWVSQREEVHTRTQGGDSIKTSGVFASVQYIRQDGAGRWTEPRVLVKDELFSVRTAEQWISDDDKKAARKIIHAAFPAFDETSNTDWMLETKPADLCWTEAYPLVVPKGASEELAVLLGNALKLPDFSPRLTLVLDADGLVRRVSSYTHNSSASPITIAWTSKADPSCKVRLGAYDRSLIPHNYLAETEPSPEADLMSAPSAEVVARPVKGLLGCTLLDNGDEAFLVFPSQTPLETVELQSHVSCSLSALNELVINEESGPFEPKRFGFDRISTATVAPMLRRLCTGGLPLLLHPDTQSLLELPFSRLSPSPNAIAIHSDAMDLSGPFGCYLWEIFVWLPFVVANALHSRQRFEDAQTWYARLFDPYAPGLEDRGRPTYDCALEGDAANRGSSQIQVRHNAYPTYRPRKLGDDPATRQVMEGVPGNIYLTDPIQNATSGFTVAFWLHVKAPGEKTQIFQGQSGSKDDLLSMHYESGVVTTVLKHSSGGEDSASFKVDLHKDDAPLQHVALVYQAAERRIAVYLNGVAQALTRDVVSKALPVDFAYLWFPKLSTDSKEPFFLANLTVFPRPLSHADVCELRHAGDRPWRAMPLRGHTLTRLLETVNDLRAVSLYAQHPGAADVVAQLHTSALQKAIVMRTIDNMVDWGDKLFGEDSWESNERATMLYVAAGDILGPRPPGVPSWPGPQSAGFEDDAAGSEPLLLEQHILPTGEDQWMDELAAPPPAADFPIPPNPELVGYWDLIDDRLHKLRHCMNLKGEERQLALYQPPMDPRALMARQAGQGSTAALSGGGAPSTLSFSQLIEHAKLTTFRVTRLGQAVLKALESKDNADVFMMALKHEREMLDWGTEVKAKEIEEQTANLEALYRGRGRIVAEIAYHNTMLAGGDGTPLDGLAVAFKAFSVAMNNIQVGFHGFAIPSCLVPRIFGTANGGPPLEEAPANMGDAAGAAASVFAGMSDIYSASADFWRRKAEQTANVTFSSIELTKIDQEIAAALKRKEILELEATNHANAIAQITARDAMIQAQFTGPALYQWMTQRASAAYFRAYNVAYNLALKAQQAYQTECHTTRKHIGSSHWDADQRGLLAGEGLLADLEQLHLAWLEEHPKPSGQISAELSLDLAQVAELRANGVCSFEISERDLALLHPGLIQRRIASMSVQLDGPVGAPSTVQATLEQVSSRVLEAPSLAGARLLLRETNGPLDPGPIAWDHVGGARAAATRCQPSQGGLALQFGDEAHPPFAGTGAVSSWRLRIPRAANRRLNQSRLEGVRVALRYDAQDGGSEFTRGVIGTEALRVDRGLQAVSLRATHPHLLDQIARGEPGTLHITEADLCCPHLKPDTMQLGLCGGPQGNGQRQIVVRPVVAAGVQAPSLKLSGQVSDDGADAALVPTQGPRRWELTVCRDHPDSADADSADADSADAAALDDVVLLIHYEGELDWSGLVDD